MMIFFDKDENKRKEQKKKEKQGRKRDPLRFIPRKKPMKKEKLPIFHTNSLFFL